MKSKLESWREEEEECIDISNTWSQCAAAAAASQEFLLKQHLVIKIRLEN